MSWKKQGCLLQLNIKTYQNPAKQCPNVSHILLLYVTVQMSLPADGPILHKISATDDIETILGTFGL